jgi:hypothetical protein
VLWNRNLILEEKIQPLRPDIKPAVSSIGPLRENYQRALQRRNKTDPHVSIGLNTAEFGLVNELTGEYIRLGRD